jgi:hypothetical protein
VPVVPTSMPRKSLMTASAKPHFERELYLPDWPPCQVGAFKIQPERRKTLPFLFQKTLGSAGITGFVLLSHDDAVEAGAVGLALLVLRSALWRSGILVITIPGPGAKELSYSQRQ